MTTLADHWLPAELHAWRPAERLTPSAWAEKHRVLTRRQSARPGKWRNANTPYLTGLMDLCVRRDIEEITIVKAAQIGVSEALRNVIGYYAHQDPDPILLVLPDEQSGRKIVAQRIIPLLKDTLCLRELFTPASRDIQLRHLSLANGFTLRLGWSGSPATMAADPCRIVINDEVDKFQPWSGRESDPISLGYARTQTYEGRRMIVNVSTPTTANGLIWRRYESTPIHLHYLVPCPHCGEYQRLTFSHVKWPKFDQPDAIHEAAAIEREEAAWYECEHCGEAIQEDQRPAMIRAGQWVAEGQRLDPDGTLHGEAPTGRRVGLHIWAGYCLWIPLYRIAAEFLRTKDDPLALMGFMNSWLGEPFHQQITHAKVDVFQAKATQGAAPARVVPAWARGLIATADTQKDHFYYVIRAWGYGYRSQRIDHGLVTSFDELRQRVLAPHFPWEDQQGPSAAGSHGPGQRAALAVKVLGIDSGGGMSLAGSRTHEVYRFALTDPNRIKALKGDSHVHDVPFQIRRVTYQPPDRRHAPFQVFLTLLDSNHFKDRLAYAVSAKIAETDPKTGEIVGEVEQWALNSENDPDYNRQMAAEHKILVRKPGGRQVEVWAPISSGAANHYWDCEYMQFALADMLRVDLLPAVPAEPQQYAYKPREPLTMPDGRPYLITEREPGGRGWRIGR